ncbi:MAG: GIY-YIG nuclease family protein [Myxococcaceae bacterium]|nr:MAG: GIY-YIG nuclease family protein [Myxococcaceae bacterium]
MANGKSIRIYLDAGDVSGIRYAEVVNWTGQALLCPRARISELSSWSDEIQRPGVYFLIGADQLTTREVYVGESESVLERLQQQLAEKDFWQEAVAVTSKDENLTKAHVRFLEARLVELTGQAGRYRVVNGNQPGRPGLPRPDRDAMEEFLGHLRLLLGALGHRMLEPLLDGKSKEPGSNAEASQLTFTVRNAKAQGVVTDEGFVVLKGSTALAQMNQSMSSYAAFKTELIKEGKLSGTGDLLTFGEDVLFSSPTAAAAIISGSSTNGRVAWRNAQGVTLKQLEEMQSKQESAAMGLPAATE